MNKLLLALGLLAAFAAPSAAGRLDAATPTAPTIGTQAPAIDVTTTQSVRNDPADTDGDEFRRGVNQGLFGPDSR